MSATERIIRRVATAVVFTAQVAWSASYTYTKIADNAPGSQFSDFAVALYPGYAINNSGVVAFTASQRNGPGGVFAGSGAAVATISQATANISGQKVDAINDSGLVVFTAGGAIYTANGATSPFLVADSMLGQGVFGITSFPALNNAGTVAFATLDSIYTRTGSGQIQTVLGNMDLPRALAALTPQLAGVSINNSGAVAFAAGGVSSPCACGVFIKDQGPAKLLAAFLPVFIPPINDRGSVAFGGRYQNRLGIYLASGGTVATAVDLEGQGSVSLYNYSLGLNNNGQVVYGAAFTSKGIGGVFTGPDPLKDKVIVGGDALFGSTVFSIGLPFGANQILNDKGQVVFAYTLTNGISGIAVATPVASGLPAPTLPANSIVNAGSFSSTSIAAPGSIVSIFGSNFIDQLAQPSGSSLPTSLNGVSVTFNGIAAPLFFVAPGQINAQVPFEVTGTSAIVQVNTPNGQSETRTLPIAQQSPAIYTLAQTGSGQGVVVFANTATIVGPVVLGQDWRPARPGDTVVIYANGLGAVTPSIASGSNSCNGSACLPDFSNLTLRQTVVRPAIEIGGVRVPDNLVLFSGLVPQFVGLYQINVTIPDGIRAGQVPIIIRQGNNASPSNVTIAVQ